MGGWPPSSFSIHQPVSTYRVTILGFACVSDPGVVKAPCPVIVTGTRDPKGDDVTDPVNHPSHYTQNDGVECIDFTRLMSCGSANAFKYLWRCRDKYGSPIEDLRKAAWYLRDEIANGDANLYYSSPENDRRFARFPNILNAVANYPYFIANSLVAIYSAHGNNDPERMLEIALQGVNSAIDHYEREWAPQEGDDTPIIVTGPNEDEDFATEYTEDCRRYCYFIDIEYPEVGSLVEMLCAINWRELRGEMNPRDVSLRLYLDTQPFTEEMESLQRVVEGVAKKLAGNIDHLEVEMKGCRDAMASCPEPSDLVGEPKAGYRTRLVEGGRL